MGRRSFLAGSAAWIGGAWAGVKAEPGQRVVSIIHTTDLHGHITPTMNYGGTPDLGGFARCATRIRRWRIADPHALLLDIGDVYQGTCESHLNRGALMLRLFQQLGYDAWVPGNHDFDWGAEVTMNRVRESAPAVIAANLTFEDKPCPHTMPWNIVNRNGVAIGLIGLITPGMPAWLPNELLGGFRVTDPVPALKRSVAEARHHGAQAIIVMSHMGWRHQDDFANPLRTILKEVPDVDVLLAGHTHQHKPSWTIGRTLCTQASYYGIHCGRVSMRFDGTHGRFIDAVAETELMDASVEGDPALLATAAKDLGESEEILGRKVATVTRTIRGKGSHNELAMLICESISAALRRGGKPVDGVFHGTFGTGDIQPGDITVADCWRIIPYENELVTAKLAASDLIEILREERKINKSDRILWPFALHLDQQGSPLRFLREGREVNPEEQFTIAFNAYDAQSGGHTLNRLHEILSRPSSQRSFVAIDTRTALIGELSQRASIP